MKRDVTAEEMRRYLIGDYDAGAGEALERAYFSDPVTLERLELVEADLVDDYVTGRLPPDVREKFERHYLASREHRVEVELARALRRRDVAGGSVVAPYRMLAIAAAIVLAVGGVALVLMQRATDIGSRAPGGDAATTTPRPTARPGDVAPPETPPVLATLTLTADAVRSEGQIPVLSVPPDATYVELLFRSELEPTGLRVELASIDRGVVWVGAVLPVQPASPTGVNARVLVERGAFTRGDYVLAVVASGAPSTSVPQRYAFRIVMP